MLKSRPQPKPGLLSSLSPTLLLGLALTVFLYPAGTSLAVETPLPRHPAPSPDGSEVVFSWQGDLWLVSSEGGTARRLTAHPAVDRIPVWSSDGRWIAFASDRYGNQDVFAMPRDGSEPPRRLTFASVDDRPTAFLPDSSGVLFTSTRDEAMRRGSAFYTVSLEGGTPALALPALGLSAAYSPDGQQLALTRGGTRWNRRGYRGFADRDLWLWRGDDGDGAYEQLTDFNGDDDAPGWIDGGNLVFRSARSGRKNVFRLDLATRQATQLTFHDGSDIRFPRVSADGRLVAYEFEDGLWVVPSAGGEPRRLEIQVPADLVRNPVERRVDPDGALELAISPDGEHAAFIVHGDVFVTAVTSKDDQEIAPPPTVRLTHTPQAEQDLSWSPDGEALLVTSYSTGRGDLYLLRPKHDPETIEESAQENQAAKKPEKKAERSRGARKGKAGAAGDDAEKGKKGEDEPKRASWTDAFEFDFQRLTSSPVPEAGGRFSPDGEHIAFVRERGDLRIIKADGSGERGLFDHWGRPDFRWSPDAQWLAYAREDQDHNSEIWIQSVDGDEAYNVSRHPGSDSSPRWSPDGKRLIWLSERHGDSSDLWGVWLAREDHERTPAGWLAHWKEKDKGRWKGMGKGRPGAGGMGPGGMGPGGMGAGEENDGMEDGAEDEPWEPELPEMAIDFDDLWRRAEALTDLLGDEDDPVVSSDGKKILFTARQGGEQDLYSVRWDGEKLERLTEGGTNPRALQTAEDGTVFYLDRKGTVKRLGPEGKPGDPVPFTARYEIDHRLEAEAVFEEVWQALEQNFYDPNFHGVDWEAQREKYRPWALAASDPTDFSDVVNLMLGELNASHMGYFLGGGEDGDETGWIGALFDPAAGGPGLRVREVLRGSPAGRLDVGLRPGDRLLEVDGHAVEAMTNVYQLFVATQGQKVRLRIRGEGGSERNAVVIPTGLRDVRQLRYREWIRQRQALVDEWSGGRLGYLHIQGMDEPSFEEFERDLYAAGHGKEGLIIDVRSNGGGWTTDYLMAALNVRRHARTVPRGADPEILAYPQGRLPLAAWTRPALAICDEQSYSNAEIFSHAFKTLDRGILVGYPTFGAVISTGGTRLVNGGFVRLPFRGWYVAGSDVNMEVTGAEPNVIVPQPPAQDTAADRDTQLQRSVEVFLEGLEENPRYGAW